MALRVSFLVTDSLHQYMPAEFAPHERTIMCWPARAEIWGAQWREAEDAYAEVANTIAQFEPVTMVVDPKHAERAESLCGAGVSLVTIPLDDSWSRDSGPIYVHADGSRLGLDFTFTGWGHKFSPFSHDAAFAYQFLTHENEPMKSVSMVLEGGSITVDGAGTLATTMQCLLHPNRNPHLSMQHIENVLRDELGVTSVVWLPHGLALDDDTDGHVDNVAAFTAPGHLLLQGCSDENEDDYMRMAINEKVASSAIGGNGGALAVDVIPVLPFTETENGRVVVPYLNFYVGNNFVLIPVCGNEADDDMVQMIGSFFTGRTMVPLHVGKILAIGGGGIHCITQQVPV